MASPVPRKASLSPQRISSVGMKNYRTGKQLEADLERLEKERRSKLRELNQESKHFLDLKLRCHSSRSRDNSPSRCLGLPPLSPGRENSFSSLSPSSSSLSSRSASTSPPKSRSPSPRPPYLRKSLSTEENHKQRRAPSSSPEPRDQLLPKRQFSLQTAARCQSFTDTTVTPLSVSERQSKYSTRSRRSIKTATENILRNNAGLLDVGTSSSIPQIVINDASCSHPAKVEPEIPNEKRNTSGTSGTRSKGSKVNGPDGSLVVPLRKCRRNSVPIPPSYLQSIATRESTFVTGGIHEERRPIPNRPRSRSVCVAYFEHLKDAPRRDSLLRKYLAKRGSYRRTSVTLERLIADLARGVHHTELLKGHFGSPRISEDEWEKLKECRYLRMPSQDEDVTGNTLDLDEIFSKSEKPS